MKVNVVNRSVERGQELALSLDCPFIPLDELVHTTPDLLINTTPVGIAPQKDQCPVPEQILKKGMVVMDIIYNPLETRLLAMARVRDCVTINGLGMFIHQGAEQFRLWTGLEPPINAMARAVAQALQSPQPHGRGHPVQES